MALFSIFECIQIILFFRKSNISELTDQELLAKYRQDSKASWLGELYNRYSHLVYGLCLKYLKDKENARDATLAIFEKLIHELKSREVATFQHWLYAVSRNHCLELIRVAGRDEKRRVVFHADTYVQMPEEMEVLSFAEMKEQGLTKLEYAIQRLSDDQKECVKMFYLQEKSYREITETTGYTLKEVKTHLQNGRRNLKNLLNDKQ